MAKQKIIFDVVAALIERKGKILVCQRSADDLFGSLWEFPGGKVEPGEKKVAALAREITEELGVEIQVGGLINTFEDEIPTMKIKVFLYRCQIKTGQPRCIECQNLKWAGLSQIGRLKLAPIDRKIHTYMSFLRCSSK